jgi:hypothetical protein
LKLKENNAAAQPALVQEIDWKDQYEKQKRRAEMWIAKYEKDIGPLEYAAPAAQPAQQEPVAWMHEWEDGERIPKLHPRDNRKMDKPKSVRPLVYADTETQVLNRRRYENNP